MKEIRLEFYNQKQFQFKISEEGEERLLGFFIWNEQIKKEYLKIEKILTLNNEYWYLEDNGDRLESKSLFKKSPWTLTKNGSEQKIIQRYMNLNTGEAHFSTKPWVRIGNEYHKK